MRGDQESLPVSVLGGLPLFVEYTHVPGREMTRMDPPECETVEDVVLVDRRGRRAEWAERRMTERDWDDLRTQILEER